MSGMKTVSALIREHSGGFPLSELREVGFPFKRFTSEGAYVFSKFFVLWMT